MSRIIYYLLIKPLSLLPLSILYLFSDFLFLVAYRLIGYRKDVVRENIENSFPDYSKDQVDSLIKKFYHHFSDLVVESLKLFSISKKELIARFTFSNPEVLDNFCEQGRTVIVVAGHYNNWEMLAVSMNAQIKHQAIGIYTPLTNAFFEHKFTQSRTRLGTKLLSKYDVKEYFRQDNEQLAALFFGIDQSPQFLKENTYWTTFLNQDTPVMFGSEKYAVQNNYPVIFIAIKKIKRGYYKTHFTMLEEYPQSSAYCSITERHTRLLEKLILERPEYYLWTHKRWKHKRPASKGLSSAGAY